MQKVLLFSAVVTGMIAAYSTSMVLAHGNMTMAGGRDKDRSCTVAPALAGQDCPR